MNKRLSVKLFIFSLTLSLISADTAPKSTSLRKSFYGWKQISGTCRNQRHEILMQRSQEPVVFKTEEACRVQSGDWVDFYTMQTYQLAEDVTMDHVVSLKYAYDHGAKHCPKKNRVQFYNDVDNLVLTGRQINAKKNYYAPDEWLPKSQVAQCKYVERWDYIATKYHLMIEQSIEKRISEVQLKCTPGETRTPDHLVRSQALYPTELRAQ